LAQGFGSSCRPDQEQASERLQDTMPLPQPQQPSASGADSLKTLPSSSSAEESNEHPTPITGVVADIEDLELAVGKEGEVLDGQVIVEAPQRHRFSRSWLCRFCPSTRRGRACGLCTFLLMMTLAVCLPLFWPRDPSWKLTKLGLDDAVLGAYVNLFVAATQSKLLDNASLPELKLTAEIDLDNPNYLGGEMIAPGEFTVSYKGQDFGFGSCAPAAIEARSTTPLIASVSIRMWPQIFKDIVRDLMDNKFNLTVQVRGGTTVRGPLGITLAAGARCSVHTAAANIYMNETRSQVVQSKECQYAYF